MCLSRACVFWAFTPAGTHRVGDSPAVIFCLFYDLSVDLRAMNVPGRRRADLWPRLVHAMPGQYHRHCPVFG